MSEDQLEIILSRLHQLANPDKVAYKAERFGIVSHNALGIYQKDLNALAKQFPKDKVLAEALFDSGIYEARVLCSKLFPLEELTEAHLEQWVPTFENWEICDSFCMGLFAKSKFAVPKIIEWSSRDAEFERRASFATLAAYCTADKKAENDIFLQFFPLIYSTANDNRIYVKKAVNWALRSIGKRNPDLRKEAIQWSEQILSLETKAAKWIAQNALKELNKEGLRISDYPRAIYR